MAVKDLSGISITLDMDISKFNRAMNSVKTYTSQLKRDLDNLNKALELNPDSIVTLRAKMITLQEAIEKVGEQIDFASEKRDEFTEGSSQWAKANRDVEEYWKEYEKLCKELRTTQNRLNGVEDDMEDVGNAAQNSSNKFGSFEVMLGNLQADAIKWVLKKIKEGFEEVSEAIKKAIELSAEFVKEVYSVGIEYNTEMEKYSVAIKAMLDGDSDAADDLVASMTKLGSISSFDTSTLLEASQQLLSADVNAQETTDTITGLAKALAYAGKGNDELNRMTQNLQQIKNVGKATAVDIKQFAYAGINVYQLLADELGVTTEEIKNMDITYEMISSALISAGEEGGKYADALEVQASTLSGQMTMLESNAKSLAGYVASDLTSTLTDTYLPAINNLLQSMGEAWQEEGALGLVDAFQTEIGDVLEILGNKETLDLIVEQANILIKGLADTFDPTTPEGAENKKKLEEACENIGSTIGSFIFDNIDTFIEIGRTIGDAIKKGINAAIYSWLGLDILDANGINWAASIGRLQSSGGYGDLPRLSSGGFASGGVTLNANFNISNGGSINESTVKHWAKVMAGEINEQLGGLV